MNSLWEIEYEVEGYARERLLEGGSSLWQELVKSSRKLKGAGCDGLLMAQAEKHTQKLLSQLDEKALHEISLDTENGILAVEQGFHDPERCEMEHDIALDVQERLLESICREAQKKRKKRRRK